MTVRSTSRSSVEAVRVAAQERHRLVEMAVVHQPGPRRDRLRDHGAARLEPAVTGGDHRRQHPFVDPEPSEPLRDDHVDRLRKLHVQHVPVDHFDDLSEPVRGGKLLREHGDRRPLHRVHARSSCPRREHAQDAASRSDVEHDVARTHHSVDRTPEALGAHAVADHRPVHLELGIHRVRRVPDRRPHRSLLGCWGGVLPDRRRSSVTTGLSRARRERPGEVVLAPARDAPGSTTSNSASHHLFHLHR